MTADPTDAVSVLLVQTEQAHGAYETSELNGVYDQDWANWYAAYAVEHGIGELVGHPLTVDQLAQFLANSHVEFKQGEPPTNESWAAYTARRVIAEL